MTFRELMIELADRVGRQHLPVRDGVSDINDFLDEDAVHHDLVKRIVRAIYRANRCGFLDAQVQATETFDALGSIQGDVLRDEAADYDQVALLQNLGDAAAQILPLPQSAQTPSDDSDPDAQPVPDTNAGSNVRPMVRQAGANARRS